MFVTLTADEQCLSAACTAAALADCAACVSLSAVNFSPMSHIPSITLTLRADKSVRAVQQLPTSLGTLSGESYGLWGLDAGLDCPDDRFGPQAA